MHRSEPESKHEAGDDRSDHIRHAGRGVVSASELYSHLEEDLAAQELLAMNVLDIMAGEDKYRRDDHDDLIKALQDEDCSTVDILYGIARRPGSLYHTARTVLEKGAKKKRQHLLESLSKMEPEMPPAAWKYNNDRNNHNRVSVYELNRKLNKMLHNNVLYACVLDSPEQQAVLMAKQHAKHNAQGSPDKKYWETIDSRLPDLRYVTCEEMAIDASVGDLYTDSSHDDIALPGNPIIYPKISHFYLALAETYRRITDKLAKTNSDISNEDRRLAATEQLSRTILRAASLDGYDRFSTILKLAQIGDQVRLQIPQLGRQPGSSFILDRFVGRADDNPYEEKWRDICKPAAPIAHNNPTQAHDYLVALGDEYQANALEQLRNAHTSPAQKAIDLHNALEDTGNDLISSFWVGYAPLSLIEQAHTMLVTGTDRQTIVAHANAYRTLGGIDHSDEVIAACRDMTVDQTRRIAGFKNYISAYKGIVIDPIDIIKLGKALYSRPNLYPGTAKSLRAGYTVDEIIRHPWINPTLYSWNEPLDVKFDFPASGSPTQQHHWLAQHSVAQLGEDWNKNTIGKLIAIRLDTDLALNVHDASYWLNTFATPEETYNMQRVIEGEPIENMQPEKLYDHDRELLFLASLAYASQDERSKLTYGTKLGVPIPDKLAALYLKDSSLRQRFEDAMREPSADLTKTFWQTVLNDDYELSKSLADFESKGGSRHKFLASTLKQRRDLAQSLRESRARLQATVEAELYGRIIAEYPDWKSNSKATYGGEDLFHNPSHREIYRALALIEETDGTLPYSYYPAYAFWSQVHYRYEQLQGTCLSSEACNLILPEIYNTSLPTLATQLKTMRDRRQRYVQDTQTWLLRHATTPHEKLTKVWGDRAAALAAGIPDTANHILAWQAENALWLHLNKLEHDGTMPDNLTRSEVLDEFSNWTTELSRVYSGDQIVQTISMYKSVRTTEALLPPSVIQLPTENGMYTAEVLAKDDPRGTTIGADTGCCMTLDGLSASCIRSGYADANAGFFALYTPDDRLCAHSYFYVNPEHPEVLVLDNIEANKGRDTSKIIELYQAALTQYLGDRLAADPGWQVSTVQVGTRYVAHEVGSKMTELPVAKVIVNNNDIYSDASENQKMLLELTDQQIRDCRNNLPVQSSALNTTVLSLQHEKVIRQLEKQIYPRHMLQYNNRAMLRSELTMHGVKDFSFLVEDDKRPNKYVGYCIAYMEKSDVHPHDSKPILYAADIAVLPDHQHNNIGARMFENLLARAQRRGVGSIEIHARESTSYAALLSSSRTQHILEKYGYKLVNHGAVDEFKDKLGATDRLFLISLEKTATN